MVVPFTLIGVTPSTLSIVKSQRILVKAVVELFILVLRIQSICIELLSLTILLWDKVQEFSVKKRQILPLQCVQFTIILSIIQTLCVQIGARNVKFLD